MGLMEDYQKRMIREGYTFRPTTDEWCPTFDDGTVGIKVCKLGNGKWRVCVWGGDDFGMEIDVATREEAERIFKSLPSIITIQDLKERGFVNA